VEGHGATAQKAEAHLGQTGIGQEASQGRRVEEALDGAREIAVGVGIAAD
jgi:hypothetical protein